MNYYKDLLRAEARPEINLMPDFFCESEKVIEAENDWLESICTEEEVKKVVFDSYSDGAPGPDGLPFMFFQSFWDVLKNDLMDMFQHWYDQGIDIFRLNFAMITLIPKENDARNMKNFRPISLLNCCFKIFTKVLTNSLALIIGRLISERQFAFVRGRYILESIVTAHEVIHSVKTSGQKGLVLKIDNEKAYDKVNLGFSL